MRAQLTLLKEAPWLLGAKEAIPLLGGYVPVAISFGLVAVQAGFSPLDTVLISTFIYAGASQFLFVAMYATGAPLWLVVIMTLLINARHVVYGPNIAQWITKSRWWPFLLHGLTDQVFALSHTRLPQLQAEERLGWFTGASLVAWFSWVGGTALGAFAGEELIERWPLLVSVMPFALPALFLVLLAPRFNSRTWSLTLCGVICMSIVLKLLGLPNMSIPLAALFGAMVFYVLGANARSGGKLDEQ